MGTMMTVHFVLRPMRRFRLSGDIGCTGSASVASGTFAGSLRGDWPGEGGGVNMKERAGGKGKEREGEESVEEGSLYSVPSSGTRTR